MSEKHNRIGTLWARTRTVTSWASILAFISLFAAQQVMGSMNPAGYHSPWPTLLQRPESFENAVLWRNLSLLIAFTLGLISLPRRPALVGLGLTIVYAAYGYVLFAMF